jgi:hypothetical protein
MRTTLALVAAAAAAERASKVVIASWGRYTQTHTHTHTHTKLISNSKDDSYIKMMIYLS